MDATGLNKELASVDKQLNSTQSALRDVNKLLKLDPKNTELLTQKQNLLQKSIQQTEERLKALKKASEEAAKTAGNYDKWKADYTPIQEEIVKTNKKLDTLKKNMKSMEQAGDVNTEGYKKAQADVSELETKLESLKQQKKQVDEEFGHPISPEGMDALKREIQATEMELKNLKDTAGSASATLAKISESTGTFGKKAESLGQSLLPVTAGVAAIGAASVTMANNFDDAMSQAAGALDKPMSEMGDLRKLAIQTGQDTIFSATDAGNAITELAKGGLTEADIKAGALQATMDLAASSGMDLGNAANVVVQAMGAFGLQADKSAQAANALAGAAAASSTDVEPLTEGLAQCSAQAYNAGWNIQETTAVLGRFADAGITGSDAGTSLKTMLQRLAAPTDQAAGLIEELGIQTRDSSGNLLGAADMADELKNKLSVLSPAERDAALQTIFGSDAMRAATVMMNSGSEGLKKYIQATNDQEAAQRLANSQMGEGSKAIEELKGSLETAGIVIGDTIAPVIKELAEFISDLANKFSSLPSGVQKAIVIFGTLLAAAGPFLIMIGKISIGISALTGAFSKLSFSILPIIGITAAVIAAIVAIIAIIKNWGSITEWFGNLWDSICSGIQSAWDGVKSFFAGIPEWWNGIWNSVANTFNDIWNDILSNPVVQTIVTTIQNLFQGMVTTLQNIWSGLANIAKGAWNLIKNVVLGPVLLLTDLVTGDLEQLASDAKNIWNNIKNAGSTIWDGIKSVITAIVSSIVSTVTSLLNGLLNNASSIWNGIKNTIQNFVDTIKKGVINGFNSMVSGIKSAISGIGNTIKNGFRSAIDFITSLPGKAVQWGKDFINGLKDGILSGVNGIVNAVRGIGDKIRSFLHFSRPDEGPLRDYETWMPDFIDGLVQGIDKNIYKVTDAMKRAAGAIRGGAAGELGPMVAPAQQDIVVNFSNTTQIGNREFDSYIVKTAKKGISGKQQNINVCKGYAYV